MNEIREIVNKAIEIKEINGQTLNAREIFILSATAHGKPVKQIAGTLKITERNVSKIKLKLRQRIGVLTNAEVLQLVIFNRMI